MSFDNVEVLTERLREIAGDCVSKGPGYAQEGVILREARKALDPRDLDHEQMILDAWHSLFTDGDLAWGYNLDNPGAPFFHEVAHQPATTEGAN